jgi:xanthine dehydrogenase accessory factor
MDPFHQHLTDLLAAGTPFVAVTLVDAVGSTPADAGSKMLVTADGLAFGTVGGGRVEARAIDQAKALLTSGQPRTCFVNWNLQADLKMTCGGAVKLFFESHAAAAWDVVVFGAGHVAQAVVRTLLNLDCRVTCLDPRADWLAKLPESPKLTKLTVTDLAAHVDALAAGASVLLMTTGHSTDLPILVRALRRAEKFAYLGVIGSAAKRAALRRGVLAAGIDDAAFATVHCPMGLDLGTNHPFEIAISVVAQLLAVRDAPRPGR